MSPASYISPKAQKGIKSKIAGLGLISVQPIKKGEIIAIKGGHIIDWKTYEKYEETVGMSILQIDEDFILAPLKKSEVEGVTIFLNHSCEPNVGLRGEITFVAMRNIKVGEELVVDYAMIQDNTDEPMQCNCGSQNCRKIVTGKDWRKKKLQERYGEYFSAFLRKKIGK